MKLNILLFGILFSIQCFGQNFSVVGTGTGSNTSTTYPTPYGQWYFGAKHQFLVTAAELLSAGITAGASISSIGFNVISDNGSSTHDGFQVIVYSTALADPLASSYFTTGQVSSSTNTNYNPSIGWNQHSITPFVWNGTNNLVVQTCFNNSAYTTNATTQWSNSMTGTSIKSRYFSQDASNVCANTVTNNTSTTTRPNIRLGWAIDCTPGSTSVCDEYISNLTLNTINNVSSCTEGGYMDYSNLSTTLIKNSTYSASVSPSILGSGNSAYPNDEIAIWIDYNNDQDFTDVGEQVGYVLISSATTNQYNFPFTVPSSAVSGLVRMRVRISYQPSGSITPCGIVQWGETEDYSVNITQINTPVSPSSVSSNTSSICQGGNATLTVNGSSGTTYWFTGTCGATIASSIGNGVSISVTPSFTTTYYAKNYSSGVWSTSCASTTINVSSSPLNPPNPTSNSPQCNSVTLTRSGTPSSGVTWYWQGTNANGTSTSIGSGTTYTVMTSGTYYIRAINTSGCWSSSNGSINVTISGNPNPPPNPTSNSPQCNEVTITRSSTPPTGITWYWQGTNPDGTSTSLGSANTFTATTSGSYYLRAQNTSGCWSSSSGSINVSISGEPAAPANPTSDSPNCGSVLITRNGTPPTDITWYWQGTNPNGISTSTGSATSYTATTSGNYYIRARSSANCWSSSSAVIPVTVLNNSTVEQNTVVCDSYTAPDGANYTSSGQYQSILTNAIGCDSIISINLIVNNNYSVQNTIMACQAHSWIDGITYTSDNNTATYLLSSIGGCDSLVTLDLHIGQPSGDTTFIQSTALESYEMNGITYTENGTYFQTLSDQYGCDSTVALELFIEQASIDEGNVEFISIHPNPSETGLFFLDSGNTFTIVEICDSYGRKVNFRNEGNSLDLSNLEKGCYFIHFKTEFSVFIKKIIFQ